MVEMKSEKPTVAIIGAGVSGICTSIELQKKLGITAKLFEMADDIGGTWKQNTYPGCSCDLPSHIYVLSSDLNPDWSTTYSSQAEILEYFKSVAKKHDIYQHTRFNTEVVRAAWIEEKKQWRLDLRDKHPSANDDIETVYFDILFSGVGSLRIINVPSEFKAFKGPIVHTGAWDNTIDFRNKRIALVGSGSSAIQSLPYLAEHASRLISYQRSAPWVLPRPQTVYPDFLDLVYLTFGYPNSFFSKKFANDINDLSAKELTQLGRPDLIEKLKPTYRLGCKRVVFSSDFRKAIVKPNVILNRTAIKNITDNTIVTEDGATEEIDILVLGTGFKTQHGVLGDIEKINGIFCFHYTVVGNEGQSLTELWEQDLPQLYKSTIINGFPNMFMLLGPTTILGHHSVLLMIETQVSFAVNAIKKLIIEKNMSAIEPTLEAQNAHMAQLRSDLKGTIWTTSCSSWYKNDSGEVTNIYPNSVTRFKHTLRKINEMDYVNHPARALK
ncbi:hypothetical protein [Parasitella parasitica]|uniref:Uncharacterized protein n=1 Tax=Parasitella parasitica TaxID=35722 RepID=A0A0B7NBQ0_9FUNG|nr:hypothetical protein [Parasitella parasitica]